MRQTVARYSKFYLSVRSPAFYHLLADSVEAGQEQEQLPIGAG
jgi:hypothetical protein